MKKGTTGIGKSEKGWQRKQARAGGGWTKAEGGGEMEEEV